MESSNYHQHPYDNSSNNQYVSKPKSQQSKSCQNPADDRIKDLLVNTDLTFKQIIEQLKADGITASFNTIRRVNRNNRFRKPRYDAKLTLSQRKQLILQLKNETKPNLSSLARQYGVCHGSIWYWWDKLSRLRERDDTNNCNTDILMADNKDDEDEEEEVIDLKPGLQFVGSVRAKSINGEYINLPISMYSQLY